jgi:hypothetical protein
MGAIGLLRGSSLVLEYANDELLALLPRDGRGIPLREAYPESAIADTIALFEECFRSGEIIPAVRPAGVLIAYPRRDDRGRVFGVAGCYLADSEIALLLPHVPNRDRGEQAVGSGAR